MKLSFTTLSCPDWTWNQVVDNAKKFGYDGIEIRGIEGEMFLPKARPFLPQNIDKTLKVLKEKGLEICCLDTSCSFHNPDTFEEYISEGKETIELAEKLGTPYIRVFGNEISDLAKKEEIINRVAKALGILGDYAENKNVKVLLETHGDFADTNNTLAVIQKVNCANVGILWDINHPYKAFGEPIKVTFEKLKPYIKHTHLKDSIGSGKDAKLCLVGNGDLPILEAIKLLKESNFDGWTSLEWEKKWHPYLEEPEIALPSYIEYMKKNIK